MPKGNYDLLSSEKKTAILASAKVLFSEHAYDDVTMELLTETLDLPIATFYRYFKDKEDLFITLLNSFLDYGSLSEDFIRNPKTTTDKNALIDKRLIHTLRNAPESLLKKLYFGEYKTTTKSVFLKELLKLKYEGVLREDIDIDLIAYLYATSMYNLQLYFKEMNLTSLEDMELCTKMIATFYHSFFRYGLIKQ